MKRRVYPTDITDAQGKLIEPLLPKPKRRGPKPNVNLREILNAIFYLLHEGGQWRAIPNDLPPWQTVSSYFCKWQRKGVWEKINEVWREKVRVASERNAELRVGSIDAQSVKTTQKRVKHTDLMGERKSKVANVTFS